MKYELSLVSDWINDAEHTVDVTAFRQEVSRIQQEWINAAMEVVICFQFKDVT